MKKSILIVLLAFVFATYVFATDKGAKELDVKVGYILDNNVKLYLDSGTDSGSTNRGCILGTDFYYYVASDFALGLGINYIFDSKANYGYSDKYGFTNVYFAIKPKMNLDSDILDYFYFIGQIGYGFFRFSPDNDYIMEDRSTENGLYWALGIGLEIEKNFILEIIHSFNYGYVNANNYRSDMRYSELSINIGYKFSL
ncbi:MAG: outer membrane beta-barrel protein [Elusimicrobia bacterium]|nr:outer membrane beta-barrel protein [Elusimicrobiota bacterium]